MADNPRQDLYLEISRNLVDQEITDLRNYVSGAKILPARFVQKADAHQIFNQLEKEQKLKPGDLKLLSKLLRKIDRHDYAEQAEKIAENERKGLRRNPTVPAKRPREEDAFERLKHLLTEVRIEDGTQTDTYNRLARHVAESGLTFRAEVPKDGNCMFHAVADQLFRTEGQSINHMQLRNRAVYFLRDNPYNDNGDHLLAFVPDQNWERYLATMSRDGTWGDHIVLQAMADMFGHDVSIVSSVEAENYVTILTPSNRTAASAGTPLLLGHYAENHYASLDSSSQLKMNRRRQFPVKKKPAPCREEELPVGGVHRYFYYIKENVSSGWKDLAFHLDFRRSDIDNIDGRNRDDKSRCMDLLEEWLKRNGERATIEVLMEALSEANLQCVVDGLRKKLQEVPFPVPASVPAAGTKTSSLTDVFQTSVKKYYELKLSHFKPLIWNDNFTLSLSDIFTQLELVPPPTKYLKTSEKYNRLDSMRGEQRKELMSLDDLFNTDITGPSTAPRCILIEGEAGGGKTTFLSKEALDAVSKITKLGRWHDIVLLVRLREVREGETIEEMVWHQCVPETTGGIDALSIREILQMNESCVLFLLDGYDELRPEAREAGQAIPKLLSGKLYPNSTVVITSRPLAGVRQYTRPDRHVHIMGFSPEQIVKYVRKYLSHEQAEEFIRQYFTVIENDDDDDDDDSDDDDDDDDRLSDDSSTGSHHDQDLVLKDHELLNNLIQTPIFLVLVCLLWEENQEMVSTGTMTGLYDKLQTFLVRKYCEREGVVLPTEELPTEVVDSLLQLGKLALEALLRNETLLDLTEVEREKVNWEFLLKLGVVSLEHSSSKLYPRKQLNFSHKTMQEFLAGRYVAHALLNQDIVELLQLTSISKALELSNLLQFTCGCDSRAAQAVIGELSKLSRRELTHLRPEHFERLDVPMDQDMQKSCQTYDWFAHLCLTILCERQEPQVLQVFSQALPIILFDGSINSREGTAFLYYIQNLNTEKLPAKLILEISEGPDKSDIVKYMEQCFAASFPGLKLDLEISGQLKSPHQTARLILVLKNVPALRTLALISAELTPSSLQTLVQGFTNISLLEELDLSGNPGLGDAGMEVLEVGLLRTPHLVVLRLGRVGMTAVGMSSLAPNMRHLVGLRELDISNNHKIGDSGLESLTAVLGIFTAMQELVLEKIGISPTGMRTLVPVLCQLTRLTSLNINLNDIFDLGLECLAAILPHLTAMKVLTLYKTRISDRGILALIKALPHLVQLQVLNVVSNDIGDSGIVSLVQTLCQSSSLDMEQNPPGDKSLTTAPHYNNTLQELHIGFNRGVLVLGDGMGRVAKLISALPALTELDMSGYAWYQPAHLSDIAAMALAEALPRLPALERLYLEYISMEPAGFQAVLQAAEEHPTLEELIYSEDLVPMGADTTACCLVLFGR
ncbi:NLRP10 [Branchiostoma lanceolatum]|uniref:NLRP10 protein n=1 Tax=Branchiostoma lanceolatum TaxID=7740 RepID=A0A8J9VBX2_BRALA|nr:NLRP10 [Branchiostoma lanceolatum]